MAEQPKLAANGETAKALTQPDARVAMNYPLVKVKSGSIFAMIVIGLIRFLQHSDMQEEMRLEAVDVITSAMEKYCMIEQASGPSRHYDVG